MKNISRLKVNYCSGTIRFSTLWMSVFFILSTSTFSQTIIVIGKSYDKEDRNLPLPKLMIINKRTNNGTFSDSEGKFTLSILKSDTLLFSAIGFRIKKVCFRDSLPKKQYYLEVALQKLQYDLKEVSVFADRSLNEIQKDIDRLGIKNRYSVHGVDAISSPITALYERFSKFGKAKRKVAQWEDEDLKRDILKDLFRQYIKYDVIDLSEDDFDDFINYLHLSDEFIQNTTQFELVTAIKGRYESFKYRWK